MTTYFSEDFETCDLAGWTTAMAQNGTVTCSNARAHSGSYSMRIYSPALSSYAYAYKNMTEAVGDHHVRFYIWVESSVTPETGYPSYPMGLRDVSLNAYSIVMGLAYHDAKFYLQNHNGTVMGDVCELATDQWVKIDAYFNDDTDKIKYYVDDDYKGEFNAYNGAADPDQIFPIGDTSSAHQKCFFYIDDIIVDDATPPPIAYSVTVAEKLGMIDSIAKPVFFKKTVTEKLGMIDAVTPKWQAHVSVAEKLGFIDAVKFVKLIPILAAEKLGLIDSVESKAAFHITQAEKLGLKDSIIPKWQAHVTAAEKLGLKDAVSKPVAFKKAVAEVLGLADAITPKWQAHVKAAEKLGLIDSIEAIKCVCVAVAEKLGLIDREKARKIRIGDLPDHSIRGGASD